MGSVAIRSAILVACRGVQGEDDENTVFFQLPL